MMRYVMVAWWLLAGSVAAEVVCVEKSTGRVLETQSHGTPGICLKNLVTDNPQYGLTAEQLDERLVTPAEARLLLESWKANPNNPEVAKQAGEAKGIAEAKAAVKLTLGLTEAQFQDLKKALNR